MRAIVYERTGEPDVLCATNIPTPIPTADEVQVQVLAIAVDYVQLHLRRGGSGRVGSHSEPVYGMGNPPWIPGGTACVEVVEVGKNVRGISTGECHLLGGLKPGSYVEFGVVPARSLVNGTRDAPGPTAYPESLSPVEAAAFNYAPVAYHTLRIAAGLQPDETVLIHAAAGGTGVLAIQLAKQLGATVIGVVGNNSKIDAVRALGADHVINGRVANISAEVAQFTNGSGVDVVWDPVGGDIFTTSPELMAEGGRLVSLGSNSFTGSAQVDFFPFWTKNIRLIGWGGRSNAEAHAKDIMRALHELVAEGKLTPVVGKTYGLENAAAAHAAVESRNPIGKVVLIP